ncbi:MAG TPA: TIGR02206 family membrane protein [Metabacillus sp.]|nr:TIGR02206 family membrane protein [Metabacillus sp.]
MDYFSPKTESVFILFSIEHLITLFTFIIITLFIYFFRNILRKNTYDFMARFSLFLIMILSEISLHVWLYWDDSWSYTHSLPLHLSSITLLLSAIMLLSKSYSLFEFTFFAGVGSAIQAMITPDISDYIFPHYRYIHFFVSHGCTVLANLYMVFVIGFRPRLRSICRAFLWLNAYAAIIFVVNLLIGGNYMYISRKPLNPTMIDYFGPWPWYIIPLEFVALGTFFLLYLPFAITKWKQK